jgi:hypothetical protein
MTCTSQILLSNLFWVRPVCLPIWEQSVSDFAQSKFSFFDYRGLKLKASEHHHSEYGSTADQESIYTV